MRRCLPSIESLTAFEASARHLSFTRAADELSLTQSAVCKQVAVLEEWLGVRLFNRIRKRLSLTEAGHVYARQVVEGLDRLERDTVALMAHQGVGHVIELAVIPTFATRWLIPRLPDFQRCHPGITLNLTTRAEPFLFTDTAFDAAIHCGSAVWPGAVTTYLFGEEAIPVMAPGLLGQQGVSEPAALLRFPLLHQSARHDAWPRWFEAAGVANADALRGQRFELFSMLVEAARAGLGVALVPRFFVQAELRSGELVCPHDFALSSDMSYYLVCPEARQDRPALKRFAEWLVAQAAAYRVSSMPES
ncbi:MAG: transcriptional regulator GcvA [Rhodocyclales bacterium]|nr:transcriptional regulator GcvA [Rhodocyclales bacterium]